MFEVGGVYAPYDAPPSPTSSVESGEVCDAKPPLLPAPPSGFVALALIRRRVATTRSEHVQWFEVLMEKHGAVYQFPQCRSDQDPDAVLATLRARKLITAEPADVRRHFELEINTHRTRLLVFQIPFEKTQRARRDRELKGAPRLYWVCESEMAAHDQVGPPSAFGVPIAPWALAAYHRLPLHLRFASPSPPLVLYHGSEERFKDDIVHYGLKPSARNESMLGKGVYFARWDKAVDFAIHDAYNVARATPGVIFRCIVAVGRTLTMSSTMVCTCGCGKPFVDHTGEHSIGFRTVFVADNSVGATRRAEWCVKDPDAIVMDGVFTL